MLTMPLCLLIKLVTTYFTPLLHSPPNTLSIVSRYYFFTMASTIDKIVDGFPFPTIPPIVGEPTYESIA